MNKLKTLRLTFKLWTIMAYKYCVKDKAALWMISRGSNEHEDVYRFPFRCPCCAYVSQEGKESGMWGMERKECLQYCPMSLYWGENDPDCSCGVPCEKYGSMYREWKQNHNKAIARKIAKMALKLYLKQRRLPK